MYKALMIEDHKEVRDFVKEYFDHKEIEVIEAQNGYEGLAILDDTIDIILLDIMMPGIDGYEVCKQIRSQYNTLIVFISALSEDENQLKAYEYGADDYITKPFNILEVKARIKAILRRSAHHDVKEEESAKVVECRGLKIDCESRRVHIHGKEVNLTAKEFDLLELLVFHPNKVYSREDLLNTVWGYDYPGDARTVDVHIRRLREKIEVNPGVPDYVHTKWGVGYYFQS